MLNRSVIKISGRHALWRRRVDASAPELMLVQHRIIKQNLALSDCGYSHQGRAYRRLQISINRINMPRCGKGRSRRSRAAVVPPSPSPFIKDEMSEVQTIPDLSNDVEELPALYEQHAQPDSPTLYENHGGDFETATQLQIRGIAALDQTDPEIQQLRQELHDVMRERRVTHLRNCIRRERQLLAQAQESDYVVRGYCQLTGVKRQRSDSFSSVVSVRPARPPLEYRYRGKTIQEFKTYMTKMEAHFYYHSGYYINEARKVQEGASTLSEEMREQWDSHADTLGPDRYTWQEFYGFFLDLLLRHPKRLQEATAKFRSARQRKGQSVRDFARYLARLEAEYSGRFSEWQKIEYIRSRVLEEIGRESRTYAREPRTYEAFVSHLVMVEITIPARRAVLRGKLPHPDHF